MSKEICISSTPHETRLAIVEDEQLTEVYYERENEYTLAGSIYKGRVTRVLPGMQSAFVDVGLERDAFLYVTDFMEEQEDSAEFERVPGGGAQESRERPVRSQAGREQPPAREAKEAQPARGPDTAPSEGSAQAATEEFEEGTRRWRGRRGRRNRGGFRPDRGNLGAQIPQTSPRADAEPLPAESAPSYPAEAAHPPVEIPAYLPGESLSKYGGQAAATETPRAGEPPQALRPITYTPSKPSTLIDTPIEWDGVGLLPGESLSRYRKEATEETSNPVPPHESASIVTPVEISPEPAHLAEAVPEPVEELDQDQQDWNQSPESESAATRGQADVVVEALASSSYPSAEADLDAPGEIDSASAESPLEEPVEFEPEEASASYRVDPSAPSEFRVPTAPQPSPEFEPVEEPDTFPAIQEIEHHFRSETYQGDLAPQGDDQASFPASDAEDEIEEDDFEDLEFTSAPSMGLLEEEEVSEEEEYDFTGLYTPAEDHDLEDMEEETLDQQAVASSELDDLVRDTHIEQRVNAEASGLAIDEEEAEDEGIDTEAQTDAGEAAGIASPGQPARRERPGPRRDGRGGRHDGRRRNNGRRQTAQTSELPVISELLKQGQEILVQIAKEPIAKKGARITSHIALPGRFLVFMPTVNHVGVSRKISSDEERQRLKRILISEKGAGGGGFIVRTAADGASEEDLRADIRFLISLWTEIKQRADTAKAPALIYHDLNLVERILRDQVSDNFSTIWVDSEVEYERIVRFLNRFQPSLVRRVKLYTKETPLFEQFGIQEEIGKALKSKVWLKSGGSIVINQTEALVAIDINTGKYVGKTARLEDTILKTNLDAIPEIVRQIRLRDLGGIIVIDFIDMDERKNRHKVMQALEEALKADRAPSKVLQFNDFGLVAITRKRVKQSLERTLCVQCNICAGTGMTKSPTTVCNEIYVEMRKMQKSLERQDVLLRVNPEVVKTLKANNGRWLTEIEEMIGKTVIVKSDPALHQEQFDIN
ncbi:MAG TPA: Rne/Rng family ribonuclease [Acidobacteriaceae bacterium]|nr:Rne/Rng family ribonuclease [Acidobacteriaceae bacterium]